MKEINYILLAKILSEEASEQEKQVFKTWLNQSAENKKIFESYAHFYHQSEIYEIANHQKRPFLVDSNPGFNWRKFIAKASSILLVMTFSYFVINYPFANPTELSLKSVNQKVIKSNPQGQKSKIMLPDGSSVWLNSESKIEYFEDFSDSMRLVSLNGEAYFDIVKDSLRPFVVETHGLKARVLGTTFNISAYEDDPNAVVSLIEGKLLVSNNTSQEVMLPGYQVAHHRAKNDLVSQKVDIEEIALWKDGILVFEQSQFEDIIHQLERWYGVKFETLGQPYSNWRFTGYFDNENLKNVLEVLSFGKNIEYEITGKNVKLSIEE